MHLLPLKNQLVFYLPSIYTLIPAMFVFFQANNFLFFTIAAILLVLAGDMLIEAFRVINKYKKGG